MTLNKQLLCVSLVFLSLPWAGCQYLKEMDTSLKLGQETTLQATTEVIAKALAQHPSALHPHGSSDFNSSAAAFYCHALQAPIWADGYDDEWPEIPWQIYRSANNLHSLRYRCGLYKDELALVFNIEDQQIIYNNPTRSLAGNGDRVILATGSGREYIFTAIAPGKITTRYFKTPQSTYRESRIDAAWVDSSNGYQLEIKMPLSLPQGKLNVAVIDESDKGITTYGPYSENSDLPWFVYPSNTIQKTIEPYIHSGLRLRLTNPQGLLIATLGNPEPEQPVRGNWLLRKLYRAVLASGEQSQTNYKNGVNYTERDEVNNALLGSTSSRWYRDSSRSNHHILSIATPISVDDDTIAILVAEQSSEQTAALTDQAFSRLFLLSLTVISVTALALLAYASWLSWRIRRLSKATQQALDTQGNISNHYPASRANDEIGTLTRNYAELMKRISEYTEYLQTLSRKLSHELRTPLAIIHSSLDNLSTRSLDDPSQTYQLRAKEGALRLGNILTAMSEARRIEESIEQAELEPTNIAKLIWEVTQAYNDLYQGHQLQISGIDSSNLNEPNNTLMAAPDLLVQMLDKLMDNASSFCPKGGKIEISSLALPDEIQIKITNEGPLLPETMQSQLFDNMVSMREKEDGQTHLGLGLHIVSLIVKYHQGTLHADNLADKSGVIFSITLPRRKAA